MVFWLGFQSAEHGVFKFKRDDPASNPPDIASPLAAVDPTPTPLPAHFPATPDTNMASGKDGYSSLTDAFVACWPQATAPSTPPDGEITPLEAENLFGKIKKREVLSKSGEPVKIGLLFDKSIFPAGAAGSAIETDGRWTDLRFRAGGRMLHCENPNRCECI